MELLSNADKHALCQIVQDNETGNHLLYPARRDDNYWQMRYEVAILLAQSVPSKRCIAMVAYMQSCADPDFSYEQFCQIVTDYD